MINKDRVTHFSQCIPVKVKKVSYKALRLNLRPTGLVNVFEVYQCTEHTGLYGDGDSGRRP